MSLFDTLKKRLSAGSAPDRPAPAPTTGRPSTPEPEDDEPAVPEINAAELIALRENGAGPVILDCREGYERKQARIPGSLHIPMNETPNRLGELDPDGDIVVVCAHGNRSYAVSGYLIQRGFHAINLTGGMAAWQARGGEIESDYRTQR